MAGLLSRGMIMSLTVGEMLFYGGIAGMALVALVSIVVIVILSGSRKRLKNKLNEEYKGGTP
jgi:hypothetical protein